MKKAKRDQIATRNIRITPLNNLPVIDSLEIGGWFHMEMMDDCDKNGCAVYHLAFCHEAYKLKVEPTGSVALYKAETGEFVSRYDKQVADEFMKPHSTATVHSDSTGESE